MQFTDTWLVSGLGSTELAAITPAGLLVLVIASFGGGFLASIGTFVGQSIGRGNPEEAGVYTWQGIWLAIIFGIATLAALPTAPQVLRLFGDSPELLSMEVDYFKITLLSVTPTLIAAAVAQYFIGTKRPSVPMWGCLIAAVANIALDYALIYGAAGFPKLGLRGAAWATVVASCIHATLMLCVFIYDKEQCYGKNLFPIVRNKTIKLLRLGIPSGTQNALDIVSWSVVLVWFISQFGETHIAAASIVIRCIYLSFLPAEGVCTALTTVVAKSIGRGDERSARLSTSTVAITAASYMVAVASSIFIFRRQIFGIFTNDEEVLSIGMQAMLFVAAFQIFDALNIVYAHALRGAGDTLWPMIVNLILVLTVFVGGGLIVLYAFPQFGSAGIWFVDGIYILLVGLIFALRWNRGTWKTTL